MKKLILIALLFSSFNAQAQIPVSLPESPDVNETKVKLDKNTLEISWPISGSEKGQLVLNLQKDQPLFQSIAMEKGPKIHEIAASLDPIFLLNVGSRTLKPENGWTVFFDKVPTRPYKSHKLQFDKNDMKITKKGLRTMITIGDVKAPDFEGDLEITIYNGIPLFNIAAVITTHKDSTAILYDAGLVGESPWENIAFCNARDEFKEISAHQQDSGINQMVNYRTIIGNNSNGSLAVFPGPHQYFYPLDEAFNLKSAWYGPNYRGMVPEYGIGIRHESEGDHRYVPWFNAPPGTAQRLNFFCMMGAGQPTLLLEKVKALTRDDKYVDIRGYKTMSSHFHNEFVMKVVMAGKPVPDHPEFVDVFKNIGVDIVHLGEFHYTAHPKGPDSLRLKELQALFDLCQRVSDKEFLLLPGEEPNEFLGGHWMELFPKPVYWIMSRQQDKPYVTDDPSYGKVYRIGNKDEMLKLLEDENGLAWTAHPRIKGSTGYPDKYKEEVFYKSNYFLGGAWKAMPADLSSPKLGTRVLDLLDDMNNWGGHKKIIAEADLFTITKENEMYAHMNVNYLKIDKIPSYDNGWQPVLNAMSAGRFFSTTGEILIPTFSVNGQESGGIIQVRENGKADILVKVDWTFPLNFIEIISGDGDEVFREKIDMSITEAHGSQEFDFSVNLQGKKWVRLEVWDVAANGAYTQTVYLE